VFDRRGFGTPSEHAVRARRFSVSFRSASQNTVAIGDNQRERGCCVRDERDVLWRGERTQQLHRVGHEHVDRQGDRVIAN
jgi:hypothetical protein